MDVIASLVPHAEAPELMQPRQRPLHDPAEDAQPAAMRDAPPRQDGRDAQSPQPIPMGLVAAAIGVVIASHYFRHAHRHYRRVALRSSAMTDGWNVWFFGGFSGISLGIRGVIAILAWLAWTLAGLGFIGLGARFFYRG